MEAKMAQLTRKLSCTHRDLQISAYLYTHDTNI